MTDGSVTRWIGQVKEGGESVAERELWDHYFSRLDALARQQFHDLPPHSRDEEDLALSALNSFFVRAKQDGFPRLHDRKDLWQLLAKIIAHMKLEGYTNREIATNLGRVERTVERKTARIRIARLKEIIPS